MKIRYILTTVAATLLCVSITSCKDFLDQEPDDILTDEQIFNDEVLIESVIANFYGRMEGDTWGQRTNNS